MLRAGVGVLVCIAFLSGGCLKSTHKIPRGELQRLAMLAPEQRGESVRVVQDLVGEQPPEATPVESGGDVTVIIVPDIYISTGTGGHTHRPPPRPDSGPGSATGGGGSGGGGTGGAGGGKGGSNGGGGGGAAAKGADEAWAWVILAAAAVVVLAATEGARYDGWVRLHPMHPVHLWGPGGYTVLPLAYIDPDTAAWAERAVVRPSEGPFERLGRAPLDRAGFSYSVMIGAGSAMSGDGSKGVGTAARVQFGYFPLHQLGIQLDWGFTTRDNVVDETIFDNRLGVEATFAPIDAGRFHAGIFGGVARANRFEDGVVGGRDADTALSGGALLQLEVTTRLAISGRFGMSRAYGDLTEDVLVGMSIY
jgi:hypothetical protein